MEEDSEKSINILGYFTRSVSKGILLQTHHFYLILRPKTYQSDFTDVRKIVYTISDGKEQILVNYGYHRTSTQDQHLDRGITEIENFCKMNTIQLERIYTDQQTGKNFNRPRYQVLKEDILRSGDTLIVTEVDRLGRNKQDTLRELQYFKEKGIRVMILEIPTTTQDLSMLENSMAKMIMETINNMLIELYATMAQAEIEKKEKRQREGIEAAKARGVRFGRPTIDFPKDWHPVYEKWKNGHCRAVEAMSELNLTKSTFYKLVKQHEEQIS